MLVLFTVIGALAGGFGIYQPFLSFAKAGALVPVTGFGASIAKGSLLEAGEAHYRLVHGAFEFTGQGLAVAVFFSAVAALFFVRGPDYEFVRFRWFPDCLGWPRTACVF